MLTFFVLLMMATAMVVFFIVMVVAIMAIYRLLGNRNEIPNVGASSSLQQQSEVKLMDKLPGVTQNSVRYQSKRGIK
jgi:membrane protein implicated in regulation of membrane protease activity